MLTFFQPGAEADDVSQACPICNTGQPASSRYPHYVCAECVDLAEDENGRSLRFSNTGFAGGCIAYFSDTMEERAAADCFIRGVRCEAEEARFGGIVIQPMKKDVTNGHSS